MTAPASSSAIPVPKAGSWPLFGWFTLAFMVFSQWYAIATSPADRDMGDLQKILYVHVPASWIMSITFALVFVYSLLYLWKGKDSYDLLAASSAEVGATFVGLTLVQGMIWGKPTWGVWWTWDARLTSVLVLLLFYLGYIALRASIEDEGRAGRAAAILALVGAINLPIVHFSVNWWNTLHQGASVFRPGGPTLALVYLIPLLLIALGYMAAFGSLWLVRIRAELWRRRARVLSLQAAGR